MADEEPPKNPFVRWKRHVDSHISTTLHNAVGLPSAISRSLNPRWPEVEEARRQEQERSKQQQAVDAASSKTFESKPCGASEQASQVATSHSRTSSDQGNRPLARACPMSGGSYDGSYSPPNRGTDDDNDDGSNNAGVWTTWPDWVQLARWHSFTAYSPYSPLNLRSMPQPRPLDLAVDQPSFFTFGDAFEDLLAIMCGQDMQDLKVKAEMRRVLDQMFPAGEPGFYWVRRLQAQNLLDGYFPRAEQVRRQLEDSYQSEEEVKKQQELNEKRGRMWKWVWSRHHPVDKNNDSDAKSFEEWDVEDWVKEMDSIMSQAAKDVRNELNNSGYIFGELDRIFKAIGWMGGAISGFGREEKGCQEQKQVFKSEGGPESEEDFFSAVSKTSGSASASAREASSTSSSSFDDVMRDPIDTWKKIWDERSKEFHEQGKLERSRQHQHSSPFQNSTTEETVDPRTGIRTVKTTEEKIDSNGNRTVRTEIRKVNADGEEVSRQSSYSRSMSASWSWSSSDSNLDKDESPRSEKPTPPSPAASSSDTDKRKPGWFWK